MDHRLSHTCTVLSFPQEIGRNTPMLWHKAGVNRNNFLSTDFVPSVATKTHLAIRIWQAFYIQDVQLLILRQGCSCLSSVVDCTVLFSAVILTQGCILPTRKRPVTFQYTIVPSYQCLEAYSLVHKSTLQQGGCDQLAPRCHDSRTHNLFSYLHRYLCDSRTGYTSQAQTIYIYNASVSVDQLTSLIASDFRSCQFYYENPDRRSHFFMLHPDMRFWKASFVARIFRHVPEMAISRQQKSASRNPYVQPEEVRIRFFPRLHTIFSSFQIFT